MGKSKFTLTLPRAMVLSALLHVGGIALLSYQQKSGGAFKVELVSLADGDSAAEGDGQVGIDTYLEGYVEHSSLEFYSESGVPESYMAREYHYQRMLSEDVFAGLAYLDTPLPRKPAEEGLKIRLYKEGSIEQIEQGYAGPNLHMTDKEMQKLLDGMMPRPKEEQFRHVFEYISKYNGNDGDLPKLVRELYSQNMIRVLYTASSPKINAINSLEEMLNKPQLFKYAYGYLKENPDSKVAVEMLFMLESTYQLTLEGAGLLYENGRGNNESKDVQAEVINRVQASLEERFAGNMGMLTERITEKRIELLKRVVEIGNYRRNDALFLLAGIYAGLDSGEEAVKCLKMINPQESKDFVYRKYYAEIEDDIKNGEVGNFMVYYATREILQDNFRMIEGRGRKFLWK